jgi:hypothetical protein
MLRNFPDLDYASRALRKRRKQQKLGCGLTKICTYQQRHVALKKVIAALTLCLFCCLCVTTLQIFNRLFRHLDWCRQRIAGAGVNRDKGKPRWRPLADCVPTFSCPPPRTKQTYSRFSLKILHLAPKIIKVILCLLTKVSFNTKFLFRPRKFSVDPQITN